MSRVGQLAGQNRPLWTRCRCGPSRGQYRHSRDQPQPFAVGQTRKPARLGEPAASRGLGRQPRESRISPCIPSLGPLPIEPWSVEHLLELTYWIACTVSRESVIFRPYVLFRSRFCRMSLPSGGGDMKRRLSDKTTGLITRLYEVVQPRPWFRGRPRSSAISALLRDIARSDEIGAVTALPGLLLSESPEVRDAASHAIVHLLSLVSPEELLCLGEFSEWGWWRSISTRTFRPSTIRSLAIDPTLHTSVFGIISFHHNGYVRHRPFMV